MDNVEYKSCIVPMCKNNSDIAPNLSFFEVPTKTHKYITDQWQEAIGISMDVNTVMYCCQDHFDLQDDTYNYVQYYISGDANGKDKIQLQLKYDAVPHRFECQYQMGHRIKPVSTDCDAIEGSSSDIDPLTCSIPAKRPLEEINQSDVNISNHSTTDSDKEEVLDPLKDTNDVKEPEKQTTNAIEGSSSDIVPLTCSIPTTPLLEETKHSDVNISSDSTTDSDEDVLGPIKDTNEVKGPGILTVKLTTNANSKIRIIDNKIVNKTRLLNIYKNKRPLVALCKPLKLEIEDLKNILVPKFNSLDVLTDRVINKSGPEYGIAFKRKQNEISEIVLKKRRQLISKIITWEREQSHCIALHDLQCKEMDIYYLNSDLDITTYKRIINVSRLSENEQYPFKIEFAGREDRLRVKQCCCWFNRENVIRELLTNYFRKSIEFTKKNHPCKGSICTCCCRNIPFISPYSELPDVDKTVSVWLKYMKATLSTRLGHVVSSSAIAKAMIVTPKVQIDNIGRINDKNASLNVRINNDCYQIANGHIVLYTKYEDCPNFSNIPLVVNENVCCWYARENVLNHLLKQKVSLSAVKFMKAPHLCPMAACKCCCKPKKSEKIYLPHFNAITRHTTDTTGKNMKIKIKISQNPSMVRVLDQILRDKTLVSDIPVSNTRTLQNETRGTHLPVSNTRTLQNETSISQLPSANTKIMQKKVLLSNTIFMRNNTSWTQPPISKPGILLNNTNETGVFELNTLISQTIQQRFSASQHSSELDPTDKQESTSNNSISDPISQPSHVQEPTSFLDAYIKSKNDPPNLDVEMDNTPNNNLIITSVVSLAKVQSSDETVVPNDGVNTVPDVVVVPDNPDITNHLLPTYMKPKAKPKKVSFHKCRARNPANCKCKSKSSIARSVSDLNKIPRSVHFENEDSNQPTHFTQIAPSVGSIISIAELSDLSIPVLSDETQDSNPPNICTFIHIPNTDLGSAVANNLTAEASSASSVFKFVDQASSSQNSFESEASSSHKPDTKSTKSSNKKVHHKLISESTNNTLGSSTIDVLQKFKNISFIYEPGHKLSAELGTKLKNLSTIELQILNSMFIMVEHQIKATGLENRKISFKLNNLLDHIVLPEKKDTSV